MRPRQRIKAITTQGGVSGICLRNEGASMKTLIMGSEEGSSIIIITSSSSIISIKNSLNAISLAPVEVIIPLRTALTVTHVLKLEVHVH